MSRFRLPGFPTLLPEHGVQEDLVVAPHVDGPCPLVVGLKVRFVALQIV